MARKKIVDEAPVIQQDVMEETQLADVSVVNEEDAKVPQVDISELSDQIKKLLRCYSNYAALYVDLKGGVYPADAQPNLVGDAILYQNPYYKS